MPVGPARQTSPFGFQITVPRFRRLPTANQMRKIVGVRGGGLKRLLAESTNPTEPMKCTDHLRRSTLLKQKGNEQ